MYDPDEAKGTDTSAPAQRLAGAVWATLLRRGQIGLSPSEPRRKPNEHDDFNVHFFGLNGQRMGTYEAREGTNFVMRSTSVYFAGKLIREGNTAVNEDRLGSAVKHFPYGEEPATTGQDRVKFATYYRDATTTLDYADQRYYLRTIGRFLTADPYRASAGPSGPQSWNRYAYVQGDPVNFNDPGGLLMMIVNAREGDIPTPHVVTVSSYSWGLIRPAIGRVLGSGRTESQGGYLKQWQELSEDCRKGLETALPVKPDTSPGTAARLRMQAYERAWDNYATLQHAAQAHGVDWRMLAAIGVRESNFRSVRQEGGGLGFGVFQIDIGQNPGVFFTQALDIAWAANWAAARLARNYATLAAAHPTLDPEHLLQATAASWNFGTNNITGNPGAIDVGTTGNNYGSNIVNLMDCF